MRRVLGGAGAQSQREALPPRRIGTCGDPNTSCMGAQGLAMQKGVS